MCDESGMTQSIGFFPWLCCTCVQQPQVLLCFLLFAGVWKFPVQISTYLSSNSPELQRSPELTVDRDLGLFLFSNLLL